MADTEREQLNLVLKDVKYIDSSTCLGSRNHGYLLFYMYFIILGGGESVPTNKIGQPDSVALMILIKYNK